MFKTFNIPDYGVFKKLTIRIFKNKKLIRQTLIPLEIIEFIFGSS